MSHYDNASAAAVSAATFSDSFTAALPAGYGSLSTRGFVRYQFSIDGSATAPGPRSAFQNGEALTQFDIQHDGGPVFLLLNLSTRTDTLADVRGAGAGAGWTRGLGAVSGGGSFESGLFAVDFARPWTFQAGLIVNVWGEAENDFYSTVRLTGLALFDAQGRPIEGFSLATASGVNYLAAAVPEPGSALLLGLGLLAGLGRLRARVSRAA